MTISFWDRPGVLPSEFLPRREIINAVSYSKILIVAQFKIAEIVF